MADPGLIVVLNGAPRSGKSSIVAEIQRTFDGPWMNLGVDVLVAATPARYRPGIGLRPGAERERPEVAALVPRLYAALYDAVAASSRRGLHVVVDVGHHTGLDIAAAGLAGLPAFLVGVRCPIEVIMQRRDDAGDPQYLGSGPGREVPAPVRRWQGEVHRHGVYDLEVDTSVSSPAECAAAIGARLAAGGPTAFASIAQRESQQ